MERVPEVSAQSRLLVLEDLEATEAGLTSGETLGIPVYPVAGLELDYTLEMTREGRSWHEADKLDAAEDWKTARQFGTIPHIIRYRRNQLFKHVPDLIRSDLAAVEPADDVQANRRDEWLAQVDYLTGPELVSYLVYRDLSKATLSGRDEKPRKPEDLTNMDPHETVTYRFGQGELQSGWYDNKDSFEIRTNQAGLVVSSVRKERIVRTLHEYAKYYGFHLSIPNSHLNISYQTVEDGELTPVHDTSTLEGLELSRRTVEGIMDVVSTVLPSTGQIHSRDVEVGDTYRYSAGPSRFNALRVMPDRFELRYGNGELEFTGLTALAMVAGFIKGATERPDEGGFNARIVEQAWIKPGEEYDKDRDVDMLRVLQVADFDTTGYAKAPANFLSAARSNSVMKYLCGATGMKEEWFESLNDASKPLEGLLDTIRIDEERGLVCDQDKFDLWFFDTAQASGTMQHILKQADDRFGAAYITELLGRFQPTRIHTVKTDECYITTERLAWHDLVRKFTGSRALNACLSPATMESLNADLQMPITEEELLTESIGELITNAIELGTSVTYRYEKAPSEEDLEKAIERAIDWVIPRLDKLCAGRPVDMTQIYKNAASLLEEKAKVTEEQKQLIARRPEYYAYTFVPQQRAIASILGIIEGRLDADALLEAA